MMERGTEVGHKAWTLHPGKRLRSGQDPLALLWPPAQAVNKIPSSRVLVTCGQLNFAQNSSPELEHPHDPCPVFLRGRLRRLRVHLEACLIRSEGASANSEGASPKEGEEGAAVDLREGVVVDLREGVAVDSRQGVKEKAGEGGEDRIRNREGEEDRIRNRPTSKLINRRIRTRPYKHNNNSLARTIIPERRISEEGKEDGKEVVVEVVLVVGGLEVRVPGSSIGIARPSNSCRRGKRMRGGHRRTRLNWRFGRL